MQKEDLVVLDDVASNVERTVLLADTVLRLRLDGFRSFSNRGLIKSSGPRTTKHRRVTLALLCVIKIVTEGIAYISKV